MFYTRVSVSAIRDDRTDNRRYVSEHLSKIQDTHPSGAVNLCVCCGIANLYRGMLTVLVVFHIDGEYWLGLQEADIKRDLYNFIACFAIDEK